ncbi:MAG: hypothetical protein V1716_03625 [Candidatus Uhrbacteria bacterium]
MLVSNNQSRGEIPLWLGMTGELVSITPSLHHSITPSLHHSITPSLHHSITPSPTFPQPDD